MFLDPFWTLFWTLFGHSCPEPSICIYFQWPYSMYIYEMDKVSNMSPKMGPIFGRFLADFWPILGVGSQKWQKCTFWVFWKSDRSSMTYFAVLTKTPFLNSKHTRMSKNDIFGHFWRFLKKRQKWSFLPFSRPKSGFLPYFSPFFGPFLDIFGSVFGSLIWLIYHSCHMNVKFICDFKPLK